MTRIVLIIIVICIIALILFFNEQYKRTNAFANQCIDIKNYREGLPYDLQMVNTGSTYSKYAFGTYKSLHINGCDLSLQAQSLDVDYAILKQYKDHIGQGGVVFITLAACCMLYNGNPDNPLYYMILDKKHNPKHSVKGRLEGMFPLVLHPQKIKSLIKDSVLYSNVYDSMPSQINEQQSLKIMNDMANGWIDMFKLESLQTTDFSQANISSMKKNTKILADIIRLCTEEGFTPVIVVPPFSSRLNNYYSKEFTENVIEKNVRIACHDMDVPFLNYQWDAFFQENYCLFIDGGFRLNETGSKVFVKRLANDMRQYGIEISNNNYGRKTSSAK